MKLPQIERKAKGTAKHSGWTLYRWFEQRTGLIGPAIEAAERPVPENTSSWWYVFGSAATMLLVLQVVTGILLAPVYAPSASNAWNVLQILNHQVALGWLLRAVHGWGSNFMIAIVLMHMAQVFLWGAYKFPRELTWMVGVFLLHPLLRSRAVRSGLHRLDSPVLAWFAMSLTLLIWHVPAAYDFAFGHEGWHDFEHVCFFATSMLYWWVLLRPWPSRPGNPYWVLLVYLISADFINTALSATLAFVWGIRSTATTFTIPACWASIR